MSEPSPCPICAAPVEAEGKTFPFCSSRCRLIDLGRWADQRYAVAGPGGEAEAEEEAPEGEAEDD
jgi:endogenous inhibitor of DNA gyrase (YacG/DUF329 family)